MAPARLGILMLDTRFPRIPGDIGNPRTWPFPVRYRIVPGATPDAIVCDDIEPFVQAFIEAGRALVAEGCSGIATTCGFLAPIRPRLTKALGVPVAASALEQAPMIAASLAPGREVGVLTINDHTLGRSHLDAAGVLPTSPVRGVQGSSFANSILNNDETLDIAVARTELVEAAQLFVADHPAIGALILECTNMAPYGAEIAAATGRPVYSIYTYLVWFHGALAPATFKERGADPS